MGSATLNRLRPPAYVSRETGAAELDLSVDTWDAMVKSGLLPAPVKVGISGTTPRWRWVDIDAKLSGRSETAMVTPEPFFRESNDGARKGNGRGIA